MRRRIFRRDSVAFRATSALLAALTLHFLCGRQLAEAATWEKARAEERSRQAKALGVPLALLEDPKAFHAAEESAATQRRAEAVKALRLHTDADFQDKLAADAKLRAKAIQAARPQAKVEREIAKAIAEKASPEVLRKRLAAADPEVGKAFGKRLQGAPKVPLAAPAKKKAQLEQRRVPAYKPQAPRKGKLGFLTPALKELYASAAGGGAWVMRDDGSVVPAEAAAFGLKPLLEASLASDLASVLPFLGVLPPPAPEDLVETPETRQSAEVTALAASLGHQPLALYNWVRRHISTEWYYGSKKGAAATLLEGAGNDFDTAALLIALLRASGIPARYEYATVQLTGVQVLALTGAKTVADGAGMLAKTSPAVLAPDGQTVQMERAFVRAWVPYGDYRGTGPGGEPLWVRLDAGLKETSWAPAVDLTGTAHLDFAAYLSTLNPKSPEEVLEAQMLATAKQRNACTTLDAALALPRFTGEDLKLLPSESPAPVLQSLLVFARPPANFRHQLDVSVDGVTASVELADLQGRSTTLEYPGSTPADVQAIAAAGSLANVHPFSVFVTPTLTVDGQPRATFAPVAPGTQQNVTFSVMVPGGNAAVGQHLLAAGPTYAVLAQAGVLSQGELDAAGKQLAAARAAGGELLPAQARVAAASYAHWQETAATRAFALNGHGAIKDVLLGVAGRRLTAQTVGGLPVSLAWGEYFIDVSRDSISPLPRGTETALTAELARLAGYTGSFFEAKSWEAVLSSPAISTVKALQAAAVQGVPVLHLGPGGTGTVGQLVGYSQGSLDDVNQAVAAGWAVTIPVRPLRYLSYASLEGYVLENPVDGSGVFRIGDLLNGGADDDSSPTSVPPNCPACAAAAAQSNSTTDMATGAWRETYTDLTLPGIGLPLVLSRTYSSQAKAATAFGYGWMHSYGVFLRAEVGGNFTFVMEDWREARFTATGSGLYQVAPGFYLTLADSTDGGHRLTTQSGLLYDFNAAGQLVAVTDTSGNSVTLVYSGGQLAQVVDTNGAVGFTFTYTGNAATLVTDAAGRTVHYGYTGDDLTSVTDALGHAEGFTYDAQHHVVTRTDKAGQVWAEYYDALGRWVGFKDPLGHEASAAYDAVNRQSIYVDRTGVATAYEWGPTGELLATTDGVGNRTAITRDANFNPSTVTDGRGATTTSLFDSHGVAYSVTDASGHGLGRIVNAFGDVTFEKPDALPGVSFVYDSARHVVSRSDALGTTSSSFDTRGQFLSTTAPGNATTLYGHDARGNFNQVTDATNKVRSFTFDAAGHIATASDARGLTTFTADALGHMLSTVDALNNTRSATYDAMGRRETSTDATGTSHFTYNEVGQLVATTDASGATRRTEYDAEGRVTATEDATHHRSTRKYDAAGRLLEMRDAFGNATTEGYCADVAQPCATVDALGHLTTRTVDVLGRVTAETDALGRLSTHVFDYWTQRLVHEEGPLQVPTDYAYFDSGLLQSTATPLLVVSYGYDSRGNRTSVTASPQYRPTETTLYTFDLANRLLTETNPLNQGTVFTYDASGARDTRLDANGNLTAYVRDAAGRQTGVQLADGTAYEAAYDAVGRKTLEKSPSHERRLAYDAAGRVASVTDVTTGTTIGYGHDAEGRTTSVTEGGVGRQYVYDSRGQLARAQLGSDGFVEVGHDALGRRSYVTRPNGVRTDYLYSDASETAAVIHSGGGVVLAGFTYGYDAQGRRVSKTKEDNVVEGYTYDANNQLTRVDYGANRTVTYSLDGLGNRLGETETRTVGGTTTTTTTSGSFNEFNQLLSRTNGSAVTNYAFDNNGNLTTETAPSGPTTYTWDLDNRLRGVTQPGGIIHAYEYDANGLRIRKVEAGVETRFLLDGLSILSELDSTNAVTRRYLNNPEAIDDVLAFEEGGAAFYPLKDGLGSWVAITDSTGAVVRRNEYEVYGARTTTGAGPSPAMGFTGRELDATGQRYHRDRYASAVTGAWSHPDRAGMADGPNLYQYANSAPAIFRDPTGRTIVILSADPRFQKALDNIGLSPLGSLYIEVLRRSPVEFRIVNAELPFNNESIQFGQTGNGTDPSRHNEAEVCGPGGWVRIQISLSNIDSNNANVDRLTRNAPALLTPNDYKVTDWGVLGHELFHALDYADGFPPHALEPEFDGMPHHSYPERFEDYVNLWVQASSEQ